MVLTINFKQYNNKSRKGTYVSIHEKGLPTRLYKYKGNELEVKTIQEHYVKKYIMKENIKTFQHNTIKTKIQKQTKTKIQTKKEKTINELLSKGLTIETIKNAHQLNDLDIKNLNKKILSKHIKDKTIIDIMSQPENMNKIKTRFEIDIKFLNQEGETIATTHSTNITPENSIKKIKEILSNKITITENEILNNSESALSKKLEHSGFEEPRLIKTGTITRHELTIKFRKA